MHQRLVGLDMKLSQPNMKLSQPNMKLNYPRKFEISLEKPRFELNYNCITERKDGIRYKLSIMRHWLYYLGKLSVKVSRAGCILCRLVEELDIITPKGF